MLNPSYYDLVIDDFNEILLEERNSFSPVLDLIMDYCKRHSTGEDRVIIGDMMAINLLLHSPKKADKYLLYTENPLRHSLNLSNEINDLLLDKEDWIVNMTTKIPHKYFEIRVNNRIMVEINVISSGFEGANTMELVNPMEINDVSIMSPEFHMLDIYQKLYSPEHVDEWDELLQQEKQLFGETKRHLSEFWKKNESKIKTSKSRKRYEMELINKFVKNNNKVCLIGEYAIILLVDIGEPVIVKIISENTFSNDFEEIKKILRDYDKDINVDYRIDTINVINDYSMKRMSIRMKDSEGQTELMYIYNSAYYELIPYSISMSNNTNDFIQIGSSFVLLRFLLVDIWLIRRLIVGGKIHKNFGEMKINVLLQNMLKLRGLLSEKESSKIDKKYYGDVVGGVFQKSRYIGRYVNKIIQQKIKNLKKNVFIKDYYPQEYLNKFGAYRVEH